MNANIPAWGTESRIDRLDRCRKYLYGEMIITSTVNEAIKTSLEEARDRQYIAELDDLTASAFTPPEEPEDEE
jgi:hypothetical protein